jgi:uncharacterized protein YndB with AHSA1/START domain
MSNTKTATVPALVIRRTFNAPRDRVFDAFASAQGIRSWLCPETSKITDLQADVRPGGTYRIDFLNADGEAIIVKGMYSEVRRPERLAYTWRWEEDDAKDEYDTFITVDFVEKGAGTEMTFKHEGFATEESRANHEKGWTSSVNQLETLLKK